MKKEMNFKKKNYTLSTNWIDETLIHRFSQVQPFHTLRYFQILGMEKNRDGAGESLLGAYTDILTGLSFDELEMQFLIVGEKNIVSIYVGVNEQCFPTAKNLYYAAFAGIELRDVSETAVRSKVRKGKNGGILTGYPSVEPEDSACRRFVSGIDNVIRGMSGDYWAFIVSARSVAAQDTNDICQEVRAELQETAPFVHRSVGGQGVEGNEQSEYVDYDAQEYQTRLTSLYEKLEKASMEGLWRVSCVYLTDSIYTQQKLRSILKAAFGGKNSAPYAVKCVCTDRIEDVINSNWGLIAEHLSPGDMNFLMEGAGPNEEPYCYFSYKYQLPMGSGQLAGFISLPQEESPGFYINEPVRFDSAPRRQNDNFDIGSIVYNGRPLEDVMYSIDIEDLTRHCLINGITGGGKSNTSKYLLTALYEGFQLPFLVIESAKQEYYELGRILTGDSFLVFTLGYEGKDSVGYRINPFEKTGTVSLQTHIDYLLAAFKASFEMVPPMPYVLETSIYEVYKDYGWDVVNDVNVCGRTEYPTLEDLYYKIEIVADSYGYQGEMKSNVVSALQARIGSLRIGGKGAMLNVRHSFPVEQLLVRPTVLELEAIGDDDVKAFVISCVLVQLYEFRKSQMKDATKKGIQHILLVEEAHRLLKNVSAQSGEANPQAKAVEFFCNMLAEIRSYGQGILISDQMPTKLARDVLKNTNLKICHRIVTKEDRELLGESMNMTEGQIAAVSMLKTGYAAVYSEGDSRPVLVRIPLMKNRVNKTRAQILEASRMWTSGYLPLECRKKGDGIACGLCGSCRHSEKTVRLLQSGIIAGEFVSDFREAAELCGEIDVELLEIFFDRIQNDFLKRKLSSDEKLCVFHQFEEFLPMSKAYIRKALTEYLKKHS